MERIISSHDITTLQYAVDQDPDKIAFRWGTTLLFSVIQVNERTMFNILAPHFVRGGVLNSVTQDTGGSALHVALQHRVRTVPILAWPLMQLGIDLNIVSFERRTALHEALEHGHSDLAVKLIEMGINIDIIDTHGLTELMLAITNEAVEVVHALLARGVNVNLRDETSSSFNWSSRTALHCAVRTNNIDIIDAILNRGSQRPDLSATENHLMAVQVAEMLRFDNIQAMLTTAMNNIGAGLGGV
ncbi:hypothetical protein N7456_005206 [Penicillium angulare]|uniref:Ankyrin n=1 Tax=Penicillium angulare TaxID=116970 RepID=A0A9W9FY32_9EURO|nr:hypothetical protein N7456_005206 [Penicillium angulare]